MSDDETAATGARKPAANISGQMRRFYTTVSIDPAPDGYEIRLDGKALKTPKRAVLVAPNLGIAELIAAEWQGQPDRIAPSTMPVTRLVNSAIDVVAPNCDAIRADIVAFAMNDALCYRADEPATLVARQATMWDPIITWAERSLGARLTVTAGIVHVEQPDTAREAVAAAAAALPALPLTAVHIVTTLTGSAILALALSARQITAEAAWLAAHVDEDHQIALWGEDSEASERRRLRWRDMQAAARVIERLC